MLDALTGFVFGTTFAPHGYCYFWNPRLVGLHVASDTLIFLSYVSIPVTLTYFVSKRTDLPFNWMFLCFGVFIVACGATHLIEIWNLWHGAYWLSGAVKGVTALASISTAVLLVRLVPAALALPSPEVFRRQNAELNAEIVKREHTERRLETSLHEKEALLREVHHRVKNNLQVISSLLRIQSRHLAGTSATNVLRECENRVQSMALVHKKLYQAESVSKISFDDYLRELVRDLYASFGEDGRHVVFRDGMEKVDVDVELAVPLGLIVNELVSNALKHAFPDRRPGEIRIDLSRVDDRLNLSVADSGIGLDGDFGTLRNRSMGLQLVGVLGEQINATVAVASGGGATFRFAVPV